MGTNINSVELLSDRLRELIESEAYSNSTVRDMEFILRTMSCYMKVHQFEEYTPEIGERFVAYCDRELHICASRISRAKNITGKLNRLLMGLNGRAALLPDQSDKFDLPDNLMKTLEKYLDHCACKGNRQVAIDYKYWICGRFLKNLSNLGCTEIQNVTGQHVQKAYLTLGFTRY